MTHQEFVSIMAVTEEYFEKSLSENLAEIYWQAFRDMSASDFRRACSLVIQTRKYSGFPKIAEITEAALGKQPDAADASALAFQCLMATVRKYGSWESVTFEDGALGRTVEAFGGWLAVCAIDTETWRYRRREFDSLYMANFNRGNTSPVTLPGGFELQNAITGTESDNKPVFVACDFRPSLKPSLKLLDKK